jgi:hypothetical protein
LGTKLALQLQGVTIENSMLGTPMLVSFFNYCGFYQMHQEWRQFVEEKLD